MCYVKSHRQSAIDITILCGTVTLDRGGVVHRAVELIMHEDYDRNTIENDIALIKVHQIKYSVL